MPYEIPNTIAPMFLGGFFSDKTCNIKLFNELSQGFVEKYMPDLLAWADMIVLTGVTNTFDRFLHITAYARSFKPNVIIVVGGHVARSFPYYSKFFFDYVCTGDVEQIVEVIEDTFGKDHVAENYIPRYDLARWGRKGIGYVESSRNCNFSCSFCSLTAEGNKYKTENIDSLREQIKSVGKVNLLYFLDNNFYGNDRTYFLQKLELLKEMRSQGYFKYWGALVTSDFLLKDENLKAARDSGCWYLFIGVESFDEVWLNTVNKKQNTISDQVMMIKKCFEHGIVFNYGLVFDPTERTTISAKRELDFICNNEDIPAPLYFVSAVPFPGTPFFHKSVREERILPNTKIRDLEGTTLTLKPLEETPEKVAEFLGRTKYLHGYRQKMFYHQFKFVSKYSKYLNYKQLTVLRLGTLRLLTPNYIGNPLNVLRPKPKRTFLSTTEILDPVYTPIKHLDEKYSIYFEPTMITNEDGKLNEILVNDLMDSRYKVKST